MRKLWIFIIILAVIILLVWSPGSDRKVKDEGLNGILLTNADTWEEDSYVLQANDGSYYGVWFTDKDGKEAEHWTDLVISHSEDGTVWDEPTPITSDSLGDWYPTLAQTSDGTLHATWFKPTADEAAANVYYSSSTDGKTWAPMVPLIESQFIDWHPAIMADENDVLWVTWTSNRKDNWDLFQIKNDGSGWSEPAQVQLNTRLASDFGHMIQVDGTYYLAYTLYDLEAGNWLVNPTSEILYATSTNGENWKVTQLTENNDADVLPHLYKTADGPAVAWVTSSLGSGMVAQVLSQPYDPQVIASNGYTPRIDGNLLFWTGQDNPPSIYYRVLE